MKDAFFINNVNLQLFTALLVVRIKGIENKPYLFVKQDLGKKNNEKLAEYFTVETNSERIDEDFENVFFFTTVFPEKEVFNAIRCKKRILVYEGLTTYYTEFWAGLYNTWKVACFDEILLPVPSLVEDRGLANYRELDVKGYFRNRRNLEEFVKDINAIWGLENKEIKQILKRQKDIIYFDRYFELLPDNKVLKNSAHRLMIGAVGRMSDEMLVKLHPHDTMEYYLDDLGINSLTDKLPNELIVANMMLDDANLKNRRLTFFMFNSSAAVNYYSFFGIEKFNIICLGGLLNIYGTNQEKALVSFKHTKLLLDKLEDISEVKVFYPHNIEELYKLREVL